MEFVRQIGEQSAMWEGQRPKSLDTFIAASALMQTLFNVKTTPPNTNSGIIHVDTFKDIPLAGEDLTVDRVNVISTFDIVHLIGWKYHEKQQ